MHDRSISVIVISSYPIVSWQRIYDMCEMNQLTTSNLWSGTIVPILFTFVRDSGITVATALSNHRWVRDIQGGISTQAMAEYLKLWDMVADTQLAPGQADAAVWRCTKDGVFSVKSAYQLYFMANTSFACAKPIWKSKAPMKCKFFMWLVVHRRCLTADNLARRGWPHNNLCQLCLSEKEDCTHLFVHCRYTQQTWLQLRNWARADFLIPGGNFQSTEDWWLAARKSAPKELRRDFDTFSMLVHWRIWKERNARIFQQISSPVSRVFEMIIEDLHSWRAAGCVTTF